jgi:hypothetical protein
MSDLLQKFGVTELRDFQQESVDNLLEGKDVYLSEFYLRYQRVWREERIGINRGLPTMIQYCFPRNFKKNEFAIEKYIFLGPIFFSSKYIDNLLEGKDIYLSEFYLRYQRVSLS